MVKRPSLSISFPTYGRGDEFSKNLGELIKEISSFDVAIFVSDDTPGDEIENVVRSYEKMCGKLHYRRNVPKLGHDKNILSALTWPDTDFVWLLGDSFRLDMDHIRPVLDVLNDQDFVFLNWQSDDLNHGLHLELDAAKKFLQQRIWHQALTGATIYNRRVIDWAVKNKIQIHRNFPQLSVILGYAESKHFSLTWMGKSQLVSEPKPAPYWHQHAIDVFAFDWSAVIKSHPTIIPSSIRRTVIRSHSQHTDLFSLQFLRRQRLLGNLRARVLLRSDFWRSMHLPMRTVLLVALAPNWFFNGLRAIKRRLKGPI